MAETIMYLENAEVNERQKEYTPSELQADTLFNFVDNIEYIIKPLRGKMLTPRYCMEDVKYLNIDGIERISFPMKCFCDISFHRIGTHLNWYGYYGHGFKKIWGMRQGIQPVQYINEKSVQCKDFSETINRVLKTKKSNNDIEKDLKSFLLEQLMYYKPYNGHQYYNDGNIKKKKCFADECEWRYIPNVSKIGYVQLYFKSTIVEDGTEYRKLEEFVRTDNQPNVKLMSRLPKEDYDRMVGSCDVGLIFLDHRFTIPNFPSRLLAYIQAKVPVLAVTDPNTDIGKVITDGDFGWWCESDDVDKFGGMVGTAVNADRRSKSENAWGYLNEEYSAEKGYQIIMGHMEI